MKLNQLFEMNFDVPGAGPAKLDHAQVSQLLKAKRTGFLEDAVDQMYDTLFDIFINSGEMPYGVAKAREGDPIQWIASRLERMSDQEFQQFLRVNTKFVGQKAKAKNIGA